MAVIYLLLPLVLVLISGAAYLFLLALKSGQFDDLETPALRILMEDEETTGQRPEKTPKSQGE